LSQAVITFEAEQSERPTAARCPSCDELSDVVAWMEGGYVGKRCRCGNVFIDPPPERSERELQYDGHFRTYYSRAARIRLDWIARFKPRGRLLEVGCGPGDLLKLARSRGYEVFGLEPNPACAEYVRGLGIEVERGYIEEADFAAKEFDVICHVDLLSHLPDPLAALRAMRRSLSSTGIVCFEVGTLGGIAPGWYRFLGGVGFPRHRVLYSEVGVLRLLQRAGFHVLGVKRFGLGASLLLTTVRHLYGSRVRERIHERYSLGRFRRSEPHLPPEPQGLVAVYDWLTHLSRYEVGRLLPACGPGTLFVAARVSP
jgi:SAM-dependent methyltransferase